MPIPSHFETSPDVTRPFQSETFLPIGGTILTHHSLYRHGILSVSTWKIFAHGLFFKSVHSKMSFATVEIHTAESDFDAL